MTYLFKSLVSNKSLEEQVQDGFVIYCASLFPVQLQFDFRVCVCVRAHSLLDCNVFGVNMGKQGAPFPWLLTYNILGPRVRD